MNTGDTVSTPSRQAGLIDCEGYVWHALSFNVHAGDLTSILLSSLCPAPMQSLGWLSLPSRIALEMKKEIVSVGTTTLQSKHHDRISQTETGNAQWGW